MADIQRELDALAFAGEKTQICLYAVRALIVLGDRRDSANPANCVNASLNLWQICIERDEQFGTVE